MKTLKTILLTIALLGFLLPSALQAQNDFVIEGYVTVDPGNLAKVGHPVTITTDTFNNPAAPYRVKTVYTNANGYYIDTIIDGALTGPNINYFISTIDSCKNIYLKDTVQNGQGSISYAQVDFTMDCSSNSNNCGVGFQSFITGLWGGMKFQSTPNDSTWDYFWEFGDGQTSSLMNPEHFYADTGTYYACLSVYDGAGCTSNFCDSVYVTSVVDSGCNIAAADFTYASSGNGYTIDFSTDASLPPNDTYFFWDFGDGNSSSNANPVHTFPNPVNTVVLDYKVCLTTIINSSGTLCFVRSCETISIPYVPNNNCDAEWTAFRNPNGAYVFDAVNGNNLASYQWDFGDGNTSSDPNPAHHYSSSGNYYACLTINDQGCTDTYCDSLTVVVSNTGNCIDPQVIDSNTICTTVIDPVCGCDGNTYNNSCEAYYWYGVTSWTAGTCGSNSQLSLSGLVSKGLNQIAQSAIVYLISADSVANDVILSLVDSQYTSPQGYYNFNNLAAGTYYLKAALTPNDADYAGYLPTYYDVSLFWGYATAVSNSNSNLNIALVAGNNTGGPGFVSGNISQGAGKVAGGAPIANVPILLLDMNDNAVQYTYSDANGDFELDDIAYGTYQLYAEVLDKETEPAIINITADNENVEGVQLLVGEKTVISSANEVSYELKNWKIYPNPADQQVVIEFGLNTSAEIEVGITDLLGKELSRQYYGVQNAGSQRMRIDLSRLESGVYFINLFADGQRIKASTIFKE